MGMNNKATDPDGIVCGPGVTKQSFKDECDVNKIIARFEKTGMIEAINKKQPFYGDVSALVDYHEALNVVAEAQSLFNAMSAEVRERFSNDPEKMIAFLNDKSNDKEAIEMGLVIPPSPEILPNATAEPVVALKP